MKFFCSILILFLCVSEIRAQTNPNPADEIPPPVKTNSPPQKPARAPTQIHSDSADFDLANHQVIYRGHVRVGDPEMKLTSEWLVADLPEPGGHVNHIVAETNVIIDATNEKNQTVHATADKVVYFYAVTNGVTNEIVTLRGSAKLENPQMTMTGEPIIWNRTTGNIIATNQVVILRQNLNGAAADTNSPPMPNSVSK